MAIIFFGLFIFSLAYLCVPLFQVTQKMHRKLMDLNSSLQLELYKRAGDKAFINFILNVTGTIIGCCLALIAIKYLASWGANLTFDDGMFWFAVGKSIAIASFLMFFIAPIIFAVNIKVTVDTWNKYLKTETV